VVIAQRAAVPEGELEEKEHLQVAAAQQANPAEMQPQL